MKIDVTDGSLPTEEGDMPVKVITAMSEDDGILTRLVIPNDRAQQVAAFLLNPPQVEDPVVEAEIEPEPADEPEPAPFRGGGGAEVE